MPKSETGAAAAMLRLVASATPVAGQAACLVIRSDSLELRVLRNCQSRSA